MTNLTPVLIASTASIAAIIGSSQTVKTLGETAPPTCASHPAPTENLAAQLAKFRPVRMPFSTKGLSTREVRMVRKLVEAGQDLESIFWRQSDPEGLAIYKALANCKGTTEKQIHHFLLINGSRYDLLESNKPFLANTTYEPGHALYPAGITRKELRSRVSRRSYWEIEATGNRSRAEAWFKKYGTMLAKLQAALTGRVPVDVDPITSFGESVR